jgi:hypothetical protein
MCLTVLVAVCLGVAWPAHAQSISKEITAGPDEDGVGGIDVVVETVKSTATEYAFKLTYDGPVEVLIVDTTPAEWQVTMVGNFAVVDGFGSGADDAGDGVVEVFPANKKTNNKSSTKIHWRPDSVPTELTVQVSTRSRPGKNPKYAPTSCGALYLNDGAEVFELDSETGEPATDPDTGEVLPPIATSEALCLAAVEDLGDDGIVGDGSGDEDEDGLSDLEEACQVGSDPCNEDTDGDGALDGSDADPLDPDIQ